MHFFDISTFQKCSEHEVSLVLFDLQMCFAPQRRATFSSLIWPDGSAPAALASLLFDHPEPQIIGKTQCFATFLPFRASELLSSDSFSSLIFSLYSSLLSDSSRLCFLSVHIVGSLTSKLPSIRTVWFKFMLPTRFGIYLPPQFGEFRNKLDLILLFDSFWDFMMVCMKPGWVDTSVIPGSGIKPCFSRDVEHSTAPLRARTQGKLFLGHWCCACDPDADDAATSMKISAK